MDNNISKLYPESLWSFFADICKLPHPSENDHKIRKYIVDFAKKNGIECIEDEVGNVILRKEATKGMEGCKGIVLQSHMDMVPLAIIDKKFDFNKDPITPIIDGDWVRADGTTLGADNGIGMCAALAVMADKSIKHGLIEALFTTDEETSMVGAFGLKSGQLKGEILMNLDSEDEGELYVGCAGAVDVKATIDYKMVDLEGDYKGLDIRIGGLKGGHSGLEIILQRGNAGKILFRLLRQLVDKFDIKIASASAGSMRNAIPSNGAALIAVSVDLLDQVKEYVENYKNIVKNQLILIDEGLVINALEVVAPKTVISDGAVETLVNCVTAAPDGVVRMSDSIKGLVETSLNMGIVEMADKTLDVNFLIRSSVESARDNVVEDLLSLFYLAGVNVVVYGSYNGWNPNMKSPILKVLEQKYNQLFGVKPKVKALHAGLECGIIAGAYPEMDMISFGPTIRYPHSPDEKVEIKSVGTFWEFLVAAIEDAPKK